MYRAELLDLKRAHDEDVYFRGDADRFPENRHLPMLGEDLPYNLVGHQVKFWDRNEEHCGLVLWEDDDENGDYMHVLFRRWPAEHQDLKLLKIQRKWIHSVWFDNYRPPVDNQWPQGWHEVGDAAEGFERLFGACGGLKTVYAQKDVYGTIHTIRVLTLGAKPGDVYGCRTFLNWIDREGADVPPLDA